MKRLQHVCIAVLAGCLLLFSPGAAGQGTTLSLSITQLTGLKVCPDTVGQGQLATLQIAVKNVSLDSLLNDYVYISWRNLDTSLTVFQEDIDSLFVQNLGPNDSVMLSPIYQYDSLRYAYGSNIVVVWPRVGNTAGAAADSVQLNICFNKNLFLSVQEKPGEIPLSLVPNPADDRFYVNAPAGQIIEYVRIIDSGGRVWYRRNDAGPHSMDGLPKGAYLVEVKLRHREIVRRKLIRR